MNNKQAIITRVAIAFVLLLFVFLFFCWRSAEAYDRLRSETLTRLQQIPGIAVSWQDDDSSPISRHGHIQISILAPEEWFASGSMPSLPPAVQTLLRKSGTADLYLELDTLILPGYLRGSAELMYDKGTPLELVNSGQMQPTRQRIRWQANGWSDKLSAEFKSDGLMLHTPSIDATVQPTQWRWQQQDENKLLSWQLPGLKLQHGDNTLELSQANGSLSLTPGNDGNPLPCLDLSFQKGRMTTDNESLDMDELTLFSEISRNPQGILSLVNAEWQSALGAIHYRRYIDNWEIVSSAVRIGLRLHDVEQQGLRQLLTELGNSRQNQSGLFSAINRITRSGFAVDLEDIQMQLPQGEFKASGTVSSRPFDMAQLNNFASMRSLLQASIELHTNETLASSLLPEENDLLAMKQAGYFDISAKSMLASRVRMVNGKLSANGVALPW